MQAFSVQNAAIQKQLDLLSTISLAPVLQCDFGHGNLVNGECTIAPSSDEQVNYMNAQRHNFHSNTYVPRQQFNQAPQEKKPNLEDMFQQCMRSQMSFMEKTEAFIERTDA